MRVIGRPWPASEVGTMNETVQTNERELLIFALDGRVGFQVKILEAIQSVRLVTRNHRTLLQSLARGDQPSKAEIIEQLATLARQTDECAALWKDAERIH